MKATGIRYGVLNITPVAHDWAWSLNLDTLAAPTLQRSKRKATR